MPAANPTIPARVPLRTIAAEAMHTRLIPPGTRVELELDVQERDKYGRLLAYVWRGDTLVNAELLKAGMATVMTIPPNVRRADYFYKLQQQARNRKAGFWR